ncbi:MAG: hypothetical protein QXJ94_01615 [Candidatus Bathyarchaeia archaeon]
MKNWRKENIRKKLVALALVLLCAGICLTVYPINESHIEELPVRNWSLNEVLTAYNSSFYATELEAGSFFELNISASRDVNVKFGTVGYDVWGYVVTTNPIIDVIEQSVIQRTESVPKTDTYQVEITNISAETVTINGAIYAKKPVTVTQTFYPYSSHGTLVLLAGLASLSYGVLTKSRKKRSKRPSKNIV